MTRALVIALMLAACGGGDDDGGDASVPNVDAAIGGCLAPIPCGTPPAGRVNVCGWIEDLETSTRLGDAPVVVTLSNGTSPLSIDVTVDACGRYRAADVPALDPIVVIVDDAPGVDDVVPTRTMLHGLMADQSVENVVVYATSRLTNDSWSAMIAQSASDMGAVVARFRDMVGAPWQGVSVSPDGTEVWYFGGTSARSLSAIDPSLTYTVAPGAALLIGPPHTINAGDGTCFTSAPLAGTAGAITVDEIQIFECI